MADEDVYGGHSVEELDTVVGDHADGVAGLDGEAAAEMELRAVEIVGLPVAEEAVQGVVVTTLAPEGLDFGVARPLVKEGGLVPAHGANAGLPAANVGRLDGIQTESRCSHDGLRHPA
jgi:hypothetical protein